MNYISNIKMKRSVRVKKSLTVTYRIVTPMFLAGAEQKRAELRLPSIKGALRYWYRAVNKKYNELISNEKSLTWEEDIFGGSGVNVIQSRFLMRISSSDLKEKVFTKQDRALQGLNYLSFSLQQTKTEKVRSYIEPNQTFTIQFLMKPPKTDVTPYWKALATSIWLLGHVGGLGSRSRRGFGTIALVDWNISDCEIGQEILSQLPRTDQAETVEEWIQLFHQGLGTIQEWFGIPEATHPVIDDQSSFYMSSEGYSNWNEAMRRGAELLKTFRMENRAGQKRVALGMPLLIKNYDTKFVPKGYDRIPSPVCLRVISIQDRFFPLFTMLSNISSPPIIKKVSNTSQEISVPIPKVLRDFQLYLEECGFFQEVPR